MLRAPYHVSLKATCFFVSEWDRTKTLIKAVWWWPCAGQINLTGIPFARIVQPCRLGPDCIYVTQHCLWKRFDASLEKKLCTETRQRSLNSLLIKVQTIQMPDEQHLGEAPRGPWDYVFLSFSLHGSMCLLLGRNKKGPGCCSRGGAGSRIKPGTEHLRVAWKDRLRPL